MISFTGRLPKVPWCPCCPSPSAVPEQLAQPVSPLPADTVVRIAGATLPQRPLRGDFPGRYPLHFFRAATGEALPNEGTFEEEFRQAMRQQLASKAPGEYGQFMSTGLVNNRPHGWVLLSITPGTAYPMHAHPGLEMVYIVRGQLHERRLVEDVKFDAVVGQPGPDLSTGYSLSQHVHSAGSWIINEVGSIHQSYTAEQPCLLLAVWPQGYVFFPPERLPQEGLLPVNHDVSNEINYTLDGADLEALLA